MSLPTVVRGDGKSRFEVEGGANSGNMVLFLYIDFTIRNRDIRGFIALLMDLPSIAALKEIVREFIEGLEQQSAQKVLNEVVTFELGMVLDALDVGEIVLDENSRIVSWNAWMLRVTGHNKQAVVGVPLIELFPTLCTTRQGCPGSPRANC
jgi:PAS domain-containing protein